MKDRVDGWALKREIRESGVFGYQVAERLAITESALSKRLRNPSEEQAKQIRAAIKEIKRG